MLLHILRKIIPASVFRFIQPPYHYFMGFWGTVWYRFPSKKIVVVGVTGTKGKSSVTEFLNTILEHAGHKTAILSTIRFKIGETSRSNLLKMTMPGRMLIQKLIREAVDHSCTHIIIEMTSEGAKQFRERFIHMDALVFTNLSPEHIESHGSLDAYIAAKLRIGKTLLGSSKRPRIIVANADDPVGKTFLAFPVERAVPYSLSEAKHIVLSPSGSTFTLWDSPFSLSLPGTFNILNALAAAWCAKTLGVSAETIQKGLALLKNIPGRCDEIFLKQPFRVVVDYAHTPDSLQAIYEAIPSPRICVLGNTGGGRDTWKRPVMGKIADQFCEEIFLTDEDPYDEDPREILRMMEKGIHIHTPQVILDRKDAIQKACEAALARPGSSVLITGKGTDPYIMGKEGSKIPWSDKGVATEVLHKLGY